MEWIDKSWRYIKEDFHSYPLRFAAEMFAWTCSVISAVIFAATVPNIPVVPLYMIFICGCCASGWACYTRRSFSLMANAIFMIVIDSIGLLRMLFTN